MIRAAILALALLANSAQAQTVIVYARADAQQMERVRQLARAYDPVVIDRDVPAGLPWRVVLAQAILHAQTVLVVWSARSAASVEVGAEWRLAAAAGVRLVPLLLDDTPMPAELGARQAIDWRP